MGFDHDLHTEKKECLDCHTKAGGGNNFKRGDIEEAHRNASASFDVHLAPKSAGGAGLELSYSWGNGWTLGGGAAAQFALDG